MNDPDVDTTVIKPLCLDQLLKRLLNTDCSRGGCRASRGKKSGANSWCAAMARTFRFDPRGE